MKKLITIALSIVLLSCLITISCNQVDAVAQLKDEVMALHNQDMVTHGKVKAAQSELKKMLDMHMATDSTAEAFASQKQSLEEAIQSLDAADDAMMDWMRNFKMPGEDVAEAEALKYLTDQKEKMGKVGDMINQSLEQASGHLKP